MSKNVDEMNIYNTDLRRLSPSDLNRREGKGIVMEKPVEA